MLNEFSNTFKRVFSSRWMTITIIVLAIIIRVIQLVYFFNVRVDRNYQLLATQSFVNGHGFSLPIVDTTSLSYTEYSPLVKWPPGYSLLVAPFYKISGENYLAGALIVDILFALILLFITRAILKQLSTPLYLVNLYTLVTSLFVYYFYFISSSDGIATSFFILGLYFAIRVSMKKTRSSDILLMTLFLLCCGLMKYLFMPVVLVVPVLLILQGWRCKHNFILRAGFLSIAGILLPIIFLLLYQQSISGAAAYVSDATRGFYPGNLTSAYPLIPAAFIKPETLAMAWHDPKNINVIFGGIYLLALALGALITFRMLKSYKIHGENNHRHFFIATVAVCMTTIAGLAYLSLTIAKAEDMPGNWWTFIQEARYYGLPNVLLHMCLFILLHLLFIKPKQRFSMVFAGLCLLLLIPEFTRGSIFTAKRLKNMAGEEYSWQADLRMQKLAEDIIRKVRNESGVKEFIVAGPSYYINNMVSLYSNIPYFNGIPGRAQSSTDPVNILLALPAGSNITDTTINYSFMGETGATRFYVAGLPGRINLRKNVNDGIR